MLQCRSDRNSIRSSAAVKETLEWKPQFANSAPEFILDLFFLVRTQIRRVRGAVDDDDA